MTRPRIEQQSASLTEKIIRFLEEQGGEFRVPEGNAVMRMAAQLGSTTTSVSAATKRLIAQGRLEKRAKPGKVYSYKLLSPSPKRKAPARPLLQYARQRGTPARGSGDEPPVFPVTVRELTAEDLKRLGLSNRPRQHTN